MQLKKVYSLVLEHQIGNKNGMNQKVSQKAILLIHGSGKRCLEILHKNMPTAKVLLKPDRREKQNNRPQKVPK